MQIWKPWPEGRALRIALSLVLAGGLAACARAPVTDEASPFFRIPPGSTLVLAQPLQVPAGQTHIALQGGRVVGQGGLYDVSCRLELKIPVPERARPVEPDRFHIQRVEDNQEYVTAPKVHRFWKTLYLRSERQPEVIQLVCEQWQDLLWGRDIALAQVREALGPAFDFELAPR